MKKVKLVEKLKERELTELKRKLQQLLKELSETRRAISERESRLEGLFKAGTSPAVELWLTAQFGHETLKDIEALRAKEAKLESEIEALKEQMGLLNAQVKLLKSFRKKRELQETKKEEILLERLVYQALSGSGGG
ncbi:hypothetical protein [Thermovibrio ammonificans]